jgi:(+)-trans-carveol dehydrogenase
MGRLDGKAAFITGVGRGPGRSHAIRLAEEGADIIGVDSLTNVDTTAYPVATQEDLDETTVLVEKTGRRAILSRADVRDREGLQRAVTSGIDELGRLDIVCANAGIMPTGRPPLGDLRPAVAGRHRRQSHRCVQHAGRHRAGDTHRRQRRVDHPHRLRGGVTRRAAPRRLCGTKAGVVALAKTLANEVAAEGIRVNAICPGAVATPMITANEELFKLFRPDLDHPTLQDCEPVFKTLMPMGGPWLAPEDVSNMVVFLASDEASSVSVTAMSVDQGTVNR